MLAVVFCSSSAGDWGQILFGSPISFNLNGVLADL